MKKILNVIPQQDRGLVVEIDYNTINTLAEIDIPYNWLDKLENRSVK